MQERLTDEELKTLKQLADNLQTMSAVWKWVFTFILWLSGITSALLIIYNAYLQLTGKS